MIAEAMDTKIVLVIDDELGPRESLRILLKNEFQVTTCCGVDEGVTKLQEIDPDVIIMDIKMPDKSGIQGLQEIRKLNAYVPVIMLTGYGDVETAQKALRFGANDYMQKPFDTNEMLQTIHTQINKASTKYRKTDAVSDLQRLNESLVKALAEKDRNTSLGKMSAEMIHDIKNPLSIILGYVGLLSEQLDKVQEVHGVQFDHAYEYVESIEKGVERCQELAELWHRQSSSMAVTLENLSFRDLLSEILVFVEPFALSQAVRLESQIELRADDVILGDRPQLLRAIHNLLTNAIQAVEGGRKPLIRISCKRLGKQVLLEISDNGPGISAVNMKRIFEDYFTTKPKGKGTGLGLPITRHIVEEHKGYLELSSQDGQGTTAMILLPMVS
ncbi:MAG: signal transduction histidine kinase [Candidatus Omnitrophota bacterium]|jgi:signal transduction histidine kinase